MNSLVRLGLVKRMLMPNTSQVAALTAEKMDYYFESNAQQGKLAAFYFQFQIVEDLLVCQDSDFEILCSHEFGRLLL